MIPDILIRQTCLANQLRVYVDDKIDGDPLWCSRYNVANPEAVICMCQDFFEAGADIVITNTYQSSVDGHMKYLGLSREESYNLITKAARLTHEARDRYLKKHGREVNSDGLPWISGSSGSYGAYMHDGSDYTGVYANKVEKDFLKKWHKTRIDALLEAEVDILSFETIPCQIEGRAIADLMCENYPTVKFWISFQCKDETSLASGDSFAETCAILWNQFKAHGIEKNCLALGVNCLKPKFVAPLFESVNGNKPANERIPLIVYANSGETYDHKLGKYIVDEDIPNLEEFVPTWIKLGVKILGGCCRTNIQDIKKFREIINKTSLNDEK